MVDIAPVSKTISLQIRTSFIQVHDSPCWSHVESHDRSADFLLVPQDVLRSLVGVHYPHLVGLRLRKESRRDGEREEKTRFVRRTSKLASVLLSNWQQLCYNLI